MCKIESTGYKIEFKIEIKFNIRTYKEWIMVHMIRSNLIELSKNWGKQTGKFRKRGVDYVQRMKLCCPICHSTFSYLFFLPFLFRHGVSYFTTYELVLFLYYCLRPSLNFVLFPQFLLLLSILTVTLCHFDSMV